VGLDALSAIMGVISRRGDVYRYRLQATPSGVGKRLEMCTYCRVG
jgi:hypothetical protein